MHCAGFLQILRRSLREQQAPHRLRSYISYYQKSQEHELLCQYTNLLHEILQCLDNRHYQLNSVTLEIVTILKLLATIYPG